MAKTEILKPFMRSWEGGVSNHPNDKGGLTKWGVTQATYQSVFGKTKTVVDMTEKEWDYIFRKLFWDVWQADKINDQSIANLLVDWVWGSGTTGIKLAQGVLGVVQDGIVGPKTLAAVNGQDASTLFAKLWKRRKEHFEACARKPGQSVFLRGWLSRLSGIKYGKLLLNAYRTKWGVQQRKCITWEYGILTESWI